jgi:hypothetical protein
LTIFPNQRRLIGLGLNSLLLRLLSLLSLELLLLLLLPLSLLVLLLLAQQARLASFRC